MTVEQRSSPLVLALVALITAAALVLRLVGIGYLLPCQQEPDGVIVWQASYFERPAGEGETDLSYPAPFYPRLLARMLSVLPGHSYPQVLPASATLAEHLSAAGEPYRRGRYLIAVLSTLAVPATFFLARYFLSSGWSLLAAAFMATSLLNLTYSQQARPHCASTTLSLLAMLPIMTFLRTGKFWTYVGAGVLTGVTLGCLQNGVFVLPALVLAHVLGPKRSARGFIAALVIVAIAVLGFYRYLFEIGFTNPGRSDEISLSGQSLRWDLLSGDGFRQIVYGLWTYEPVLCAIALAGAVMGLARIARKDRRPDSSTLRDVCVVLAFPLSFAAVWGWWNVLPPRFLNPLIPYLCILGAFGASVVVPKLNASLTPGQRRFACVASSLVLLAVPAYASIKLTYLRSRPDTLTLAARWIEAHVDKQRDLVLSGLLVCLPLPMQARGIETRPAIYRFPWDRYQLKLPRASTDSGYRVHTLFRPGIHGQIPAEEVKRMLSEERAQYAVVEVPTGRTVGNDFTRAALREEAGEPVFTCTPYDLGHTDLVASGWELGANAIERLMCSDRWGPPIEIYRLK